MVNSCEPSDSKTNDSGSHRFDESAHLHRTPSKRHGSDPGRSRIGFARRFRNISDLKGLKTKSTKKKGNSCERLTLKKTLTSCVQLTDVTPQRKLRTNPVTHNATFCQAVRRPFTNLRKHTVNMFSKSGDGKRRGCLSWELQRGQKVSLAADTNRVFPYAQQAAVDVPVATVFVHKKKKRKEKQ